VPWLIIFVTETQSTKQKCSVATNVVLLSFRVALCTHNFSINNHNLHTLFKYNRGKHPYFSHDLQCWSVAGLSVITPTSANLRTPRSQRGFVVFAEICGWQWRQPTRGADDSEGRSSPLLLLLLLLLSRTDHGHVHLSINFCSSTVARLVQLLQRQRSVQSHLICGVICRTWS
jgi:hypothetical protein